MSQSFRNQFLHYSDVRNAILEASELLVAEMHKEIDIGIEKDPDNYRVMFALSEAHADLMRAYDRIRAIEKGIGE